MEQINNNDYDIYLPVDIYSPDIYALNDNCYIEVRYFRIKGMYFYDVIFNNGQEHFLGRFRKIFDSLKVLYNDNMILIYYDTFDRQTSQMKITKVIELYNMNDDINIVCSEQKALEMFDKDIDRTFLTDKENLLIRTDSEKRKRLLRNSY